MLINSRSSRYRVISGAGRKFSDFYELKEVIGTGGFGSVYGGICKENKQSVCVACSEHVCLNYPQRDSSECVTEYVSSFNNGCLPYRLLSRLYPDLEYLDGQR